MTPVLSCTGLGVHYGKARALSDITITVAPGEMVAVVGANGAGKSTLVNALAGWSRGKPIVVGDVHLNGAPVQALRAVQRARLGVLLVPEGKNVFAGLTVRESLALVRQPADLDGRHVYTRDQVIELFPRLAERLDHRGGMLSGGERQMLSLACALLAGPRVLVLDEPSIGLAPRLIGEMLARIKQLAREGLPVLIVEQNVRAALKVVDRLYLMERGHIIGEGDADAMARDPRLISSYLGSTGSQAAHA